MRALALAVATLAVLAAPASAADWGVSAIDFEFVPPEQTIAVGDTVTWTFVTGGHTTTGVSGQAEAWDSGRDGANAAGTTFTKRFDTPGRYQYICTPHQVDMKGVIQVGEDEVARSLARVRTKRTGRRVTVSFTLKEPAKVSYVVRGAARKRVERRRMAPGRRSLTLRGLRAGRYSGVLTATDDFDEKSTSRGSFAVR